MTTIRLKLETKEKLEILREEFESSSYDDLLETMIKQIRKKVSMFGADKDKIGVLKYERAKFRTDSDRYMGLD